MNRLVQQLEKSFNQLTRRKWDKIYVAVDIHETVMEPTWSDTLSHKFYEDSIETLRLLSDRKDVCLILWTSSNKANAQSYFDILKVEGVKMDYINENPEVTDKHYADYASKFYVNLILDDKAGFIPSLDWRAIKGYLKLKNLFEEGVIVKEVFDTFMETIK